MRAAALSLSLVAFLIMAGAGRSSAQSGTPAEQIAGRYITTVAESDLPAGLPAEALGFLGDVWEVEFLLSGRFSVRAGGDLVVEGDWTATETDLTLTDQAGEAACLDSGVETGTYRWRRDAKTLRLTAIVDPCDSRRLVMSLRPLFQFP
jgi:hypothetical protein